jgi:hypothetical protein
MKTKTLDLFGQFIDPAKCRVDSFPGLIAVFGGLISDDKEQLNTSKRNIFIQWLKQNRKRLVESLVVPENYKDWNGLGKYKDLLAFERDLGYLTDAVIVFLEGPGSFAELGAFSQIDSLASKLIVVIASEHHQDDSFISLGPIRQLHDRFENSVCRIPSAKEEDSEPDIQLVMDMLAKKQVRKGGSIAFDSESEEHKIIAVIDLIDLFLAITREELAQTLKALSVNLDRTRIHQLLFLLEKVKLITRKAYGDQNFYLPTNIGKYHLLDYSSSSSSQRFDRSREGLHNPRRSVS